MKGRKGEARTPRSSGVLSRKSDAYGTRHSGPAHTPKPRTSETRSGGEVIQNPSAFQRHWMPDRVRHDDVYRASSLISHISAVALNVRRRKRLPLDAPGVLASSLASVHFCCCFGVLAFPYFCRGFCIHCDTFSAAGSHSRSARTRQPAFSSPSRTARTMFGAPGVSP
jgi:hypothetical protein